MAPRLLHIFRNTPMGRETFLQSVYFCRHMHLDIDIYIPEQKKFLMYFEREIVQIDLDDSYLFAPETAQQHALDLVQHKKIEYRFLIPAERTASTLPDIPSDYMYMCLPRSVSDRIST